MLYFHLLPISNGLIRTASTIGDSKMTIRPTHCVNSKAKFIFSNPQNPRPCAKKVSRS